MLNRPQHASSTTRQRIGRLVVALLLVVSFGGTLLAPQPAQAQWITTDLPQAATWVWEKVKSAAEWAWKHGAAVAYKNALKTFTTRIAYDTAVWLGSGGKGQQPLFITKGWGAYLKDTGDSAAGDFLDTLFAGDEAGVDEYGNKSSIGINVCRPGAFGGFQAKIIIKGLAFQEIQPRKPRCTLSQIAQNWDRVLREPNALARAQVLFDSRQNDLGIALEVKDNILKASDAKRKETELLLAAGRGLKQVGTSIADEIKTAFPRIDVAVTEPIKINLGLGEFGDYTGDALADALNVFTNTLGSRLLKRLQEGDVPNPSSTRSRNFGAGLGYGGGVEYAVQVNSKISTPQFLTTDTLDPISELSDCPTDVRYAPTNNCTISLKFAQALRKAQEGSPVSVQEAIDQGFIDANLRFALVRTSDDLRAPSKAWYLSDLKKLRLARVVPVGWELAAQAFAGQSISLRDVIGSKPDYADGFNDRDSDGGCDTAKATDPAGPYCGLIDPNWVLKAPAEQCRITAYGEQLQPESSQRQETCVDVQHCVAEKEDGTCQAWGYCKKDKATWRFGGESCEFPLGSGSSAWASCQTFIDPEGNQASYLKNSLTGYDDGTCSGAAGCKWYSTAFNRLGGWCKATPATSCTQDSDCGGGDTCLTGPAYRYRVAGTQAQVNTVDFTLGGAVTLPRLYVKQTDRYRCEAQAEGCRTFLRLSNVNASLVGNPDPNSTAYNYSHELARRVVEKVTLPPPNTDTYEQYGSVQPVSLKQAPSYLGCYSETAGVHDFSKDPVECKQYLQWCSPKEVGCERYTPADGSPAIPAQIKDANKCPAECVGLNSYTQTDSYFEKAPATTKKFIPATAKQCSASAAGCEEFTNVQQNERKEYYTQLRRCVRPDETGVATFYSWTGSDLTGYQLKTWKLLALGTGAPSGTTCNGEYPQNADCRQFYDATGTQVYYNLESDLVYASNQCNRYRATNVIESDCHDTHGDWRTVGGVSSCFYQAIPNQGKTCSVQQVGCREYRGPTASNVRYVFPICTYGDAEYGVQGDQSATCGFSGGTNSTESVSVFGHSLNIGGGVSKDISGSLGAGKQYLATLWFKSATVPTVGLNTPGGPVSIPTPGTIIGSATEWQLAVFGPSAIITAAQVVPGTTLLNINGGGFVDNVSLREIQDTSYVRKATWVTPQSCIGGPGYSVENPKYLRCAAYTDRTGKRVTVTGFSKICRAEAVGCEALVDTHNSDNPRAQSLTSGAQAVNVLADQVVARVFDTQKGCAATAAACVRIGKPTFTSTGTLRDWSDTFVRLDPDTFNDANPTSPLCAATQSMCQEYKDTSGATHTFKDPGGRVCEYRQRDARTGFAWYKKGTDELCNYVINPSFELFSQDKSITVPPSPPSRLLNSGKVDDAIPDAFGGWKVTALPPISVNNTPPGGAFAISSVNGRYWGASLMKLVGTGVVTEPAIALTSNTTPLAPPRLFAAYAHVNVPSGALYSWQLFISCTNCTKLPGVDNSDLLPSTAELNQWVTLWTVFSVPAATESISVGVTNGGGTVYLDQVELVELDSSLSDAEAVSLAEIPYAYECPGDESGCTAYRDPTLTRDTYYYLANSKLDKTTCAGKVSEKEGCLLFNDLGQDNTTWSSTSTYQLSHANNDTAVSPVGTTGTIGGKCDNTGADCTTAGDCDGICNINLGGNVCSDNPARTCNPSSTPSWRDCAPTPPQCLANTGICDNDRSRTCTDDPDCGGLITKSSPLFSMALPSCYATQSACRNAGGGGACSYCEQDPGCGTITPYLCNSRPPTPGHCIDKTANRCANDPERLCTDNLSCVTNPPTCGSSTTRSCSNNASRACTNNTQCGGQCLGASVASLDTNLILKVRRDRTCAEWLSCQSESPRLNQQTGRFDNVCYSLGRCDQAGSTNAQGLASCGHWLPLPPNPQPLTLAEYQKRISKDAGIKLNTDFTGYSIPDLYPVETLREKNYSADPLKSDYRLTYLNLKRKTCNGRILTDPTTPSECTTIGSPCAIGGVTGRCSYEDFGINGKGAVDLDGKYTGAVGKTCRVYPEADAPFSDAVVQGDWQAPCTGATDINSPDGCQSGKPSFIEVARSKAPGFKDANTCQKGENCLCNYTRASYSQGESLFYAFDSDPQPKFAVAEGEEHTVSRLKKADQAIGLHGYCLEKDPSRIVSAGDAQDKACLTWVPLDVVGGEASAYDYAAQAGYQGGTTYYCSEAKGLYDTSTTSNIGYRDIPLSEWFYNVAYSFDECPDNPEGSSCWVNFGWPSLAGNYAPSALPISQIQSITFVQTLRDDLAQQYSGWPQQNAYGSGILGGIVFDPRRPTINGWRKTGENTAVVAYQWTNYAGCRNCNVVTIDIGIYKESGSIQAVRMHQIDATPDQPEWNNETTLNIKYLESCGQVVKVAQGTQNKAWTGRIASATFQVKPEANLGYTSSVPLQPFGRLKYSPVNEPVLVGAQALSAVAVSSLGSSPGLYSAFDAEVVTTPYAGIGSASRRLGGGMCVGGTKNGSMCTAQRDCTEGNQNSGTFCMGYLNGTKTLPAPDPNKDLPHITGFNRLKQFFASAYDVMRWTNILDLASSAFVGKWNSVGTNVCAGGVCATPPPVDVSGSEKGSLQATPNPLKPELGVPYPPQIKQVVFGTNKLPTGEGTYGFTIQTSSGSAYLGSGTACTIGGTTDACPSPIPISADDSLLHVAFYAYNPNGEQMPIRSVIVDWGDETTAGADNGSYKNHKHVCQPKQVCTGGSCQDNIDYNWGDTSQACISDSGGAGYFKFSHVYSCDEPAGCEYRPKVYVRDNWGWCTGDKGLGAWGVAGDSRQECATVNPGAWFSFPVSIKVVQPL